MSELIEQYLVESADGTRKKWVDREVIDALRMMDWQIRELGYCPASVTLACLSIDS